MVAPLIAAALIGGGATLAGGLISNRQNKKIAQSQEALQREFAQNSIQWRVEDAKAAGLHPLYALGANTSSYSPTTYSDSLGPSLASAGQSIAQGYAAQRSDDTARRGQNISMSDSRAMRLMAMDEHILGQQRLRSQIGVDTAMANYYNSLAKKAQVEGNSQQDVTTQGVLTVDGPPADAAQNKGTVNVVPAEVKTNVPGSPSIQAGQGPLWVIEKAGGGLSTVRLNDEAAEAWGDVAAPVINAAATAYYYTFKTLPKVTKHNLKVIRDWYFKEYLPKTRKQSGTWDYIAP